MKKLLLISLLFCSSSGFAQDNKAQFVLYDGTVVVGYVNKGAYLNFTGPGIKITKGNTIMLFGMLPSLRFKEDSGTPKNAFVTPTLGFGVTYIYKHIAFQIPVYYNAKTSTENGLWHVGIGIGIRISKSKPK